MRKNVLASGLDNLYADRVDCVSKFTIMTYSMTSNEDEVQAQLNEWAEAGYIEIIEPLAKCEKMEPCIKLLAWIQPRP